MLNLYEILKKVIKESVSSDKVSDAINNKYQVIINYSDDKNRAPKKRIIEPYVYGLSSAGNEVLRAYQYNGDAYRGTPKWKLFRLDRIESWSPTNRHFNMPPNENGWNAEKYNSSSDNGMKVIFNQVSFDDVSNSEFSPNNTLNNLRKKTERLKNSNPININQLNNNSDNKEIKNSNEFQKMLQRNLAITDKEKAKRGFSLSNKNNKLDKPIINNTISDVLNNNDENKPIINNSIKNITNNNNTENNNDEFQKMLQRNLAITDKEKAKRGFSLHNK